MNKRLLSICFLFASCQHAPVMEIKSSVKCTNSSDANAHCSETRSVSCICNDCTCSTGYHFDLDECACLKDVVDHNEHGYWNDYVNGLEQLNEL